MSRTKSILFPNTRDEMEPLFDKLQRAACNRSLNASGFSIEAAGEPDPETDNILYCLVDGVLISKAAGALETPTGTVAADAFNVFVYTINAAGTVDNHMGTAGATLAAVTLPEIPDGEVAFALLIINPTGTGDFVGGTTDLDDATVVPNAVFLDIVGSFLPELATL